LTSFAQTPIAVWRLSLLKCRLVISTQDSVSESEMEIPLRFAPEVESAQAAATRSRPDFGVKLPVVVEVAVAAGAVPIKLLHSGGTTGRSGADG
jgi:hypothetical protein